MFLSSKHQLAAAVTAAIFALIGHASAAGSGNGSSDIANVRIIASGADEVVKVNMDDFQVGESRQLTAASGKPAVVTRTEDGLTIEVAGTRTEVVFPASNAEMTWTDSAEHADGKQVRVIKIHRDNMHATGDGPHRIVVMKHADGDIADDAELTVITENVIGADGEISDARLQQLFSDVQIERRQGNASGEKVIVTRRIAKDDEAQ